MSKLETNTIDTLSGTTNLTIGSTNSSTVTFENGAVTGHMYPAFEARLTSNQSVSDGVTTKVELDTEVLDTDNCYDNATNYRFTPTVAGKYFVYGRVILSAGTSGDYALGNVIIRKNGSTLILSQLDHRGNTAGFSNTIQTQSIVDMNGSTDYLELFAFVDAVAAGNEAFLGHATFRYTVFGAYRMGA